MHNNTHHEPSKENQTAGNVSDANDHAKSHGIHLAGLDLLYVESPFILTSFLVMLCIVMIAYHHLPNINSRIPESCCMIALGILIGLFVQIMEKRIDVETVSNMRHFSARTFFIFLLPPIMLDSAYSLHDRNFVENIGTILLFAVVGTLINTFLIGFSLHGFAHAGLMGVLEDDGKPIELSLLQCLLFGCIISAVDPVAVLAIFQEVGVNDVLFFLVFGESLLNDAVTVVLYKTFSEFTTMHSIETDQYILAVAAFFTVSLGGVALGVACGCLSCLITKYTKHVRVVEPLATLSVAYFAYLVAELFHWSGILSIVACGMIQWQYIRHNVSKKSYYTIKYFTKTLSTSCDAVIFLFFGIALLDINEYGEIQSWHIGFAGWTVFFCLIYRIVVTGSLCLFANKFMRSNPIQKGEIFIMCASGLRGAVGFSLAITITESFPHRGLFILTIIVVVMFTVFVQGTAIKPLVVLLGIKTKDVGEPSIFEEVNRKVGNHLAAGMDAIAGFGSRNYARDLLEKLNQTYLKHWLQKDPDQGDQEDIFNLYQTILLHQHFMMSEERKSSPTTSPPPSSPHPKPVELVTTTPAAMNNSFRCRPGSKRLPSSDVNPDLLTPREIGEMLNVEFRPTWRKTDLERWDMEEAMEMKKAHFLRTIGVLQNVRQWQQRKSSAPVSVTDLPSSSHLRLMARRRGQSLPSGDIPVDLLHSESECRTRHVSDSILSNFLNEFHSAPPTPPPRSRRSFRPVVTDGILGEIKEDGEDNDNSNDNDNSTSTSSTKVPSEESRSDHCHVTIHGAHNQGFCDGDADNDAVFDESTHL